MKNILIIIFALFCLQGQSAQSQTKKVAPQVRSKMPVKKKNVATKVSTRPSVVAPKEAVPTKKVSSEQKASDEVGTKTTETYKVSSQTSPKIVKKAISKDGSILYKAALGLKFIYGVSLTGKVFLKENSALEGILRYNSAGGLGTNIAFTGLYEYHGNIKDVAGLRWYLGGGGYVNYFSWKYDEGDPVTTFGVAGVVGLEYKFNGVPIAISADWLPGYVISNGIGFSAENGGIGVKYTF